MLCMPTLSRWQKNAGHAVLADESGMCLSDASRAALDADAHAGHAHPADDGSTPHEQQLDHGAACGYCTLATRLLPVLALVLALPLPLPARHSSIPVLSATPAAPFWRAHSPRGPPLPS